MDFKLETFLPYRLNLAAELVSQRFAAQYRARYRMTRPEWRALAALGAYGHMTATEIGANSSMHKTKVSRAVRALEEKRWLKRREDLDDRRIEHLELTPAGRRIYGEMVVVAREYERELARLLGGGGLKQLEAGLAAVEAKLAVPTVRRVPKDLRYINAVKRSTLIDSYLSLDGDSRLRQTRVHAQHAPTPAAQLSFSPYRCGAQHGALLYALAGANPFRRGRGAASLGPYRHARLAGAEPLSLAGGGRDGARATGRASAQAGLCRGLRDQIRRSRKKNANFLEFSPAESRGLDRRLMVNRLKSGLLGASPVP